MKGIEMDQPGSVKINPEHSSENKALSLQELKEIEEKLKVAFENGNISEEQFNRAQKQIMQARQAITINKQAGSFCPECGGKLPNPGIKFCPECGINLKEPFQSRQPISQESSVQAPVERISNAPSPMAQDILSSPVPPQPQQAPPEHSNATWEGAPPNLIPVVSNDMPPDAQWHGKCPICRSNPLQRKEISKFMGLSVNVQYQCEKCGSTFQEKGGNWTFVNTKDLDNPLWHEYGNQDLTDKEWKNIAYGGVSDKKLEELKTEQRKQDIDYFCNTLYEGKCNIRTEVTGKIPIVLQPGENIIFPFFNISYSEPRSVRTSFGVYGGPSIRIGKGMSYRLGAFDAESESHDELKELDNGIFIVTDQRVVFAGQMRNSNIEFKKILSMKPGSNSLSINKTGKQKTEHFQGFLDTEFPIRVVDRGYWEPCNGLLLYCLINGLIKRYLGEKTP